MDRLRPFSAALFLYLSKFKILQRQSNVPRKITSVTNGASKYSLLSFASIAFVLWPVKKVKPVDSDKSAETKKTVENESVLLENADNMFQNGHYEDCYNVLAEYGNPDSVEVQWRKVRALYNMSKDSKCDESHRKELVEEAFDLVSKLINIHDNHYAVHKWYALLLDTKSAFEGVKERITQLENVKKHMDLAVTLNPNDATTLYMLGEWCYQITEMPWHQRKIAEILFATPPNSTYEDALEYFLKAESVQPRFYSLNLLRIGSCYFKLLKEDQAKYYLQLAASYPAKSNDDHQANREAAELLKKMK